MKASMLLKTVIFAAALLLPAFNGAAQTTRGDYDYDGRTSISDVTALIDYLLYGNWNENPENIQRDTVHISLCGGYDIVMVHVEGGTYPIGEGVSATVGDFWIAQTEVTEGLWKAVMSHQATYSGKNRAKAYVSWNESLEFIAALNELTGLTFRLPRSVEWGFAARGGNLSLGFTYAGSNNPLLVAWHTANSTSGPCDVGTLWRNELGLYDMSGNVSEWCQDTGSSSGLRIHRGGSWDRDAGYCRMDNSGESSATNRQFRNVGLRLAM